MKTLAVIDYGMSNLRSVVNALMYVAPPDVRIEVTGEADTVLRADRVVFPGQGAARDCMRALGEHQLQQAINEAAATRPFLGICMGMQVLLSASDENGGTTCLDLFAGRVRRFDGVETPNSRALKIPHMGWNAVDQTREHALWQGIPTGSYFYFVHSYYTEPSDTNLVAGTTEYGRCFTSVMARENIFALQCHPEKSAGAGLRLLENFIHWDGHT